jgi:hypothetical protein
VSRDRRRSSCSEAIPLRSPASGAKAIAPVKNHRPFSGNAIAPEVSQLIELAQDALRPDDSPLRRIALTRIMDDLLRRRADDDITAAIQSASSSELSHLLRCCVENAVENVALTANDLEITSRLFCASAIVRLAEPMSETQFEAILAITSTSTEPTSPRTIGRVNSQRSM